MAKLYDLNRNYLSINGLRIGGYGEQSAIQFQADADLVQKQYNADGGVLFSRTNIKSLTCMLEIMNTSRSYRDLAALVAAQHGLNLPPGFPAPATLGAYRFRLVDDVLGDIVTCAECVFENWPVFQKSQIASAVQFRIALPNPVVSHGTLIV